MTLVMAAFIGLSASALFSITNLNMMIAGNKRRHTQATLAATSGVNHFMSLNIPVDNIAKSLRDQSSSSKIIIPRTPLDGKRTFYTVSASICCDRYGRYLPDNIIYVVSTGEYSKGRRIISTHTVTATVSFE